MGSITHCRKPVHSNTFGMELECIPNQYVPWEKFQFWERTDEASVQNGHEFVSQPMPYAMLRRQIQRLHKQIGGWQTDSNCGLHIHVSRAMWSEKRRVAFETFLFCAVPTDLLRVFFGRVSQRYAPVVEPNQFIQNKFRAINLLHPATYEFRLWAAGDLQWTCEALRRQQAIIKHTGEYTVPWLKKIMDKN